MLRHLSRPLSIVVLAASVYACAAVSPSQAFRASTGEAGSSSGGATSNAATVGGAGGSSPLEPDEGGVLVFPEAPSDGPPIGADAACAAASEQADVTVLPVDIVWMVDNSSSMAPAITQIQQGLNAFAATIEGSGLDYQVIMLSLRGATSPVSVGG